MKASRDVRVVDEHRGKRYTGERGSVKVTGRNRSLCTGMQADERVRFFFFWSALNVSEECSRLDLITPAHLCLCINTHVCTQTEECWRFVAPRCRPHVTTELVHLHSFLITTVAMAMPLSWLSFDLLSLSFTPTGLSICLHVVDKTLLHPHTPLCPSFRRCSINACPSRNVDFFLREPHGATFAQLLFL